jgi:glycosyltransferase involved in cell wall biosynthesis
MNELRFSIVIPCFNEAGSLRELIPEASKIAKQQNGEFILVDNGSTDETLRILIDCTAENIRWVTTTQNLGYGGGILLGLENCNSNVVGWTHADLQTPLRDVVEAVNSIGNYCGFVKGRRLKRAYLDNFFSLGMSIFESILFKTKLTEINAQPTVFEKKLYESWTNPPTDFSLDLYALITAKQANLGLGRIDVYFNPRKFGNSSWNTGIISRSKFILRTIRFSFTLRKQIRHANHAPSSQQQ